MDIRFSNLIFERKLAKCFMFVLPFSVDLHLLLICQFHKKTPSSWLSNFWGLLQMLFAFSAFSEQSELKQDTRNGRNENDPDRMCLGTDPIEGQQYTEQDDGCPVEQGRYALALEGIHMKQSCQIDADGG